MIDPGDRATLADFANRVRRDLPAAEIRAFGSRARGNPGPDSDFDVCIVVPAADRATVAKIREAAWETGFAAGRVITTVILTREQFAKGPLSESGLVSAIRREGVAV